MPRHRTAVPPTPFEELHAETVRGDHTRTAELRATIEQDLAERERAAGIGRAV